MPLANIKAMRAARMLSKSMNRTTIHAATDKTWLWYTKQSEM
jgi:hypothetical protein